MEQQQAKWSERWLPPLYTVLLLVGLYILSLKDYLLFHSIAELFSITVAFSVFLFAWNSQRFSQSSYLVAYLSVAGLDMLHMVAYKGMTVFSDRSANLPTQLWIAARYTQSISLLISPLLLRRRMNPNWMIGLFAAVVGGLIWSIFDGHIFPTCYVDGKGLTAFKVHSEHVIALILLGAAGTLWRSRERLNPTVLKLMIGAIFITIASELAFTHYIGVYDTANMAGHVLKIVAFYLVYRAILHTGFVTPYNLLFRELRQTEERYRALFDHSSSGLALFQITDNGPVIMEANLAFEQMTGMKRHDLVGNSLTYFSSMMDTSAAAKVFDQVRITKMPVRVEQSSPALERCFSVAVFSPGESQVAISLDDITEQKRALEQERILIATKERERMARDLHDAVSQTLFSANVIAEALPRLWKRDPSEAEKHLSQLHELTRGAMAEMRVMLLELRPTSLQQVELPTLLQQLCDAVQARKRTHFEYNANGEQLELPPDVKVGIYRVAQEALNNVIKHSQATETSVTLTNDVNAVKLEVSDNGKGFETKNVAKTSLGLEIMRERAKDIGGSLLIETIPDQGTRVVLSWPC